MVANITLKNLVNKVRNKIDIENSDHITDNTIADELNESLRNTYNLLISSNQLWNLEELNFTISSGYTYQLPYNFYKLYSLKFILNGRECPLSNIHPDDIGYNLNSAYPSNMPYGYFLRGKADGYTIIRLDPATSALGDYSVLYYPGLTTYSLNDNVILGTPFSNWTEHAVLDTCAKLLEKDMLFDQAQFFKARVQEYAQRVMDEASEKDYNTTESFPKNSSWNNYGNLC